VVHDCVRVALRPLASQIDALDEAIGAIDKEIAMSRPTRPKLTSISPTFGSRRGL
jgi:hypothetical protein